MKDKLFLLVILLLSLAIGLMMPIVEGACSNSSYISSGSGSSGGSGTSGAPVKYRNSNDQNNACEIVTDHQNTVRLGDVGSLLEKLTTKTTKTYGDSSSLTAKVNKIKNNSNQLNNLANGKDTDTGDACKKYPEAC
jgi:hypothetical protein